MRHLRGSWLVGPILACAVAPRLVLGQVIPGAGHAAIDSTDLARWGPKFDVLIHIDSLPVPRSRVEALYPDSARAHGVTGTVVIEILVGRDGRVHGTKVVKSIPALDSAAVVAVRQWTFRPPVDDSGKPVPWWFPVAIEFPPLDLPGRPVRPFSESYYVVDPLRETIPSPLLNEGPPFSVDLVPLDSVAVGHALEVGALVSGSGGTGAVANVRLEAQGGLVVANDDTSFSVPLVGAVPLRRIRLSPRRSGDWFLRARATVVRKGIEVGVEEVALAVRVNGDTLVAGHRNYYRSESIVDFQRYRASGPWWVPIDAPEEIDLADVMATPTKPVVLRQAAANCRDCDTSVKRMQLLIVVDTSGVARQVRRLGGPFSPAAEESAEAAVRQEWAFRPARVGHTPVTDWLLVSVPIHARRH